MTYRILTNIPLNTQIYTIFPQRGVDNGAPVSKLTRGDVAEFPQSVTFPYEGSQRTELLSDLFTQTDTKAFIVLRGDGTILYEAYPNGTRRDSVNTSFSVAKSFTSAPIGIALDEEKIKSVDDPVIEYLPELKGRGLDTLTIRDMLTMPSGVPYQVTDDGMFLPAKLFSDDPIIYYSPNLRQVALSVQRSNEPIGAYFRYNDYYLFAARGLDSRACDWCPRRRVPPGEDLEAVRDGISCLVESGRRARWV